MIKLRKINIILISILILFVFCLKITESFSLYSSQEEDKNFSISLDTTKTELLIYELYVHDGSSGCIYDSEYLVISNPSNNNLDFSNTPYSILYSTASGENIYKYYVLDEGVIEAHSFMALYFNTIVSENLTSPFIQISYSFSFADNGGNVYLVKGSGYNTSTTVESIIDICDDRVGYGTGINYETTGVTGLSITKSARRKNILDTDNNYNDFSVITLSGAFSSDFDYLLRTPDYILVSGLYIREYLLNSSFRPDGMIVTLYFTDSTTRVLNDYEYYQEGFDSTILNSDMQFNIVYANNPNIKDTISVEVVAPHLMIYEIYGGGGNTSASYTNSFVSLYNASDSDINFSITPYYLFRQEATASTAFTNSTAYMFAIDKGIIYAHSYIFIVFNSGTVGNGLNSLYNWNSTGPAYSGFRFVLTNSSTIPTTFNQTNIVDLVGTGTGTVSTTTYNVYEVAPTPSPSTGTNNNKQSVRRNSTIDNNNNSTDFSTYTLTGDPSVDFAYSGLIILGANAYYDVYSIWLHAYGSGIGDKWYQLTSDAVVGKNYYYFIPDTDASGITGLEVRFNESSNDNSGQNFKYSIWINRTFTPGTYLYTTIESWLEINSVWRFQMTTNSAGAKTLKFSIYDYGGDRVPYNIRVAFNGSAVITEYIFGNATSSQQTFTFVMVEELGATGIWYSLYNGSSTDQYYITLSWNSIGNLGLLAWGAPTWTKQ